jgi:hypothetical protein
LMGIQSNLRHRLARSYGLPYPISVNRP